jgi:hypothetical protein
MGLTTRIDYMFFSIMMSMIHGGKICDEALGNSGLSLNIEK